MLRKIATHPQNNDHDIHVENTRITDKGTQKIRKTLESWHAGLTKEADNTSKPLPRQHAILLKPLN